MDSTEQHILAQIAKDQKLNPQSVEATVDLLDKGNTLPFIGRYRKDETGNLEYRQLHQIQLQLTKLRGISERKSFIIKSIESQGKLTDELRQQIDQSDSIKEIEDLFLPFKSKKDSAATLARQQGLEPLAKDVMEGVSPEIDLATRATDFVRVDKNLNSIDEVIAGVSDIVVEKFTENGAARTRLRKAIWEKGVLVSRQVKAEPKSTDQTAAETQATAEKDARNLPADEKTQSDEKTVSETTSSGTDADAAQSEVTQSETSPDSPQTTEPVAQSETESAVEENADSQPVENPKDDDSSTSTESVATATEAPENATTESSDESKSTADSTSQTEPTSESKQPAASTAKPKKKKKKKKNKDEALFEEYFNFSVPLSKLAPQQILSINRGERSSKLSVHIELPENLISETVAEVLVSGDPPFKPFLETCATTALKSQVIPSLEREVRRELTEDAEQHALHVFDRNLRVLLLQPPVRATRLMAIHPGYRSGCHVAILESDGTFITNDRFHIVGNQARQDEGKTKLIELLRQHGVDLIAIGNGSGCRATEKIVSDIIAEHFSDSHLKFVIVNEAGVTQYASSDVAREELPECDLQVRCAVSIGRRLLDPLSELVKIAPGNLGVGVFQHDVKSKHLNPFLEDSVKNCVNFVGVDVNKATSSLLRYVAGLEPLTARRIIEHRTEHGPFKNLEQLKQIAGFGEATFVQAAGFLRVFGGEQPLDATSIHPENYELATKILEKAGFTSADLPVRITEKPQPPVKDSNEAATEENPTAATSQQPDAAIESSASQSDNVAVTADTGEPEASSNQPEASSNQPETESSSSSQSTEPTNVASQENETGKGENEEQQPKSESSSNVEVKQETGEETDNQETSERPEAPKGPFVSAEVIAKQREFRDKLKSLRIDDLAKEFSVSQSLIKDLISGMTRPGRDPRLDLPKPIYRKGLMQLADIKAGMQLKAQILSVVDFGVFVDIGLGESCLVHISQLSRKFVRDPHRFFFVGEILNVWVTSVDLEKKRVVMTAIRPAEHRKPSKPRQRSDRGNRGRNQRSDSSRSTRRDSSRPPRKPKKPKPAKPITQSMVDGEEPMRSFSDLAQFFKINKESGDKS